MSKCQRKSWNKRKRTRREAIVEVALRSSTSANERFREIQSAKLEKLKLLLRLRVPIGENIINDILKDTLFQLDHDNCLTFFSYQAVVEGERDENAPDNLSQLHRELLNLMVSLSKGVRFLSNEAILNSLGMDGRYGLTDKELLEEIEKAKKFIASDDKSKFRDCHRVLKSTRTSVTELLLSQAEHRFKVKKDEHNVIISYYI
ncbi:unnamed protein product [Caenorhabditis brenneri]